LTAIINQECAWFD
jgi:ATP-binding cassette subfamily B (MDR/TAP) protein 1